MSTIEHFRYELFARYADFKGRTSRRAFWSAQLITLCLQVVLGSAAFATMNQLLLIVYFSLAVILIIPSLAISTRRLHDVDKSAWWFITAFIPPLGLIIIIFQLKRGTTGANRYGEDPLVSQSNSFKREFEKHSNESIELENDRRETVQKVITQGSVADELQKLSDLKREGILTEEEFQDQKAKLLGPDSQNDTSGPDVDSEKSTRIEMNEPVLSGSKRKKRPILLLFLLAIIGLIVIARAGSSSDLPEQISLVSSEKGSGEVLLKWVPVEEDSAEVTHYGILLTPGDVDKSGNTLTIEMNNNLKEKVELREKIEGLSNRTTYEIKVRAKNSEGWGPWSATLMVRPFEGASLKD